MNGRAMVCIAFHFSQSRGGGRWRGFLLEKGGKELYSGGGGEGARWVPIRKESIRQILDR